MALHPKQASEPAAKPADTETGKRDTPAKAPRSDTRAEGTTVETAVAGSVLLPGAVKGTRVPGAGVRRAASESTASDVGRKSGARVAQNRAPGDPSSSEVIPAQDSPHRQVPGTPSDAFSGLNLDSTHGILGRRQNDGKGSMAVLLAVAGVLSFLALLVFLLAR